jgi:hypothetical protein
MAIKLLKPDLTKAGVDVFFTHEEAKTQLM